MFGCQKLNLLPYRKSNLPVKPKSLTAAEAISTVSSGLRAYARKPNIYGYEADVKQLAFHKSQARTRLLIGGNRSGKTTGGAVEMVRSVTGTNPYRSTPIPFAGRAIGVDFPHGIEMIVKPEIARWLPLSYLKGGSWDSAYNRELKTLTLENLSTIEFMSYDQDLDKFSGTSRDGIWFDEEPPQTVYIENKLRLLDSGGSCWLTMTPVEGMSWSFDDIFTKAATDPNIDVFEVDTFDNTHLNPSEIDLIMSGLSSEEIDARIHGKYVQLGGLIYKEFKFDVHTRDELNLDELLHQPNSQVWVAYDHGYTNPACFLWLHLTSDLNLTVFAEIYESQLTVEQLAMKVHEMNLSLGVQPRYYVGDPSIVQHSGLTGKSVQTEFAQHGVPIVPANNDVRLGVNALKQLFKAPINPDSLLPRLTISRACPYLIWELQRYRWATWLRKKIAGDRNLKEEPHKKNDHACDTLRYGVMSQPSLFEPLKDSPPSYAATTNFPLEDASSAINPFYTTARPNEKVGAGVGGRNYDEHLGDDW